MTVLLVLFTFLVFIVLDYILNRRKAIATVSADAPQATPAQLGGGFVDGFHVPEHLSYHPGHSWLVRERKNVVRVGADEFAAALAGKVDRIELPKPGQWIRQGQKVLSFYRDGEKTEMVSPTEGEVMEVNTEVLANPALVRDDPYQKGWLVAVHVPDEENTSRNLVPKGLVGQWMRESVERLYAHQPGLAGRGRSRWRTSLRRSAGRPSRQELEGSHGRVFPYGIRACEFLLHI